MRNEPLSNQMEKISSELFCLSTLTALLSTTPADESDPHKDRPTALALTDAINAVAYYQERLAEDVSNLWLPLYRQETENADNAAADQNSAQQRQPINPESTAPEK